MQQVKAVKYQAGALVMQRVRDYSMLFKFRLTTLVVFSSGIGFLMAQTGPIHWNGFWLLILGGFMVTGASNALNQVIEKDFDRLMKRTENRPLPTGRMTTMEALLVAGLTGVAGITLLYLSFNALSALFSAVALLSYAFIYTPLKRFSPVAVFVGAIPGALPALIGWVSATGEVGTVGLFLFGIQFMWQFPHFWAIAWVAYDDYTRAGYKLLPSSEGRTRASALQNIIYIIALIPVSLLPFLFHKTGVVSAVIVVLAGIFFLYQAVNLFLRCDIPSAKKLMFGSFFYLPIVQLALYFDRI